MFVFNLYKIQNICEITNFLQTISYTELRYHIIRKMVLQCVSKHLRYVFRNLFFMDNGFPLGQTAGVCPLELILHVSQESLGLAFGSFIIGSYQEEQIEIESDIHAFQLPVIPRLHIDVPLRMCQNGDMTF